MILMEYIFTDYVLESLKAGLSSGDTTNRSKRSVGINLIATRWR